MADLFGAMEQDQVMGFDAEQLLQAASSMRGEHFQMMDADSAYAMIETIDIQQALALEGERLAGIFGAMDDVQITGFSGESFSTRQRLRAKSTSSSWTPTVPSASSREWGWTRP